MAYILTPHLQTFLCLAMRRMKSGHGASLLLTGLPGGGKTSFAKEFARKLGVPLHYYSGTPDKERDLLYEIDVQGVLDKKSAWVPGPAWTSFQESRLDGAVLLIDEIDKTHQGFDAFLLRLLEDGVFRAPDGSEITADKRKLAVILTSNGRRPLRPELLRRCQRIEVPLPEGELLFKITDQIAGKGLPRNLISLLCRMSKDIGKVDAEQQPSPKEIALCCLDLLELKDLQQANQEETIEMVVASWFVKGGGVELMGKALPYKWKRAISTEIGLC